MLDKVATWMNNGVQLQLCRSEYIAPIIRSFAMLQFSPGRRCLQCTCDFLVYNSSPLIVTMSKPTDLQVWSFRQKWRMQDQEFFTQLRSSYEI